ncbi:nucleotidyltransferase family protein [Gammaproteobacteria bacterium]|nr:nucleotidyltransferase family protein [Gammaproteobacteria bacterium]
MIKPKIPIENWRAMALPLGSTIQQAVCNLEASSRQIVLVVSETEKLIGTLTDGDIRRAFLKGFNLESVIDDIIKRDPKTVPSELSLDMVLDLMLVSRIHQLPIVDNEGKVLGLHLWDEILVPKKIKNTLVIMAGGKGKRLRPYTGSCPKPMLEVDGKPLLEHIILKACNGGIINFVISLGYLGHIIEEYFGDGSELGVSIQYLREEQPLGTAGCLSLLPELPKLPVVVTNGDVLTDVNYLNLLDFHSRHSAQATMVVRQQEMQNQFGVVQIKGVEIQSFEEKPIYRCHINAGIYVLEPSVLEQLKHQQYCDMPDLFQLSKQNGARVIAYPIYEPWLDVGRPEDLDTARNLIR